MLIMKTEMMMIVVMIARALVLVIRFVVVVAIDGCRSKNRNRYTIKNWDRDRNRLGVPWYPGGCTMGCTTGWSRVAR